MAAAAAMPADAAMAADDDCCGDDGSGAADRSNGGDVLVVWDGSSSSGGGGRRVVRVAVGAPTEAADTTPTTWASVTTALGLPEDGPYQVRAVVDGVPGAPMDAAARAGTTVGATLAAAAASRGGAPTIVRLVPVGGLRGGKGGFGSNLRAAGRAAIKQQTRDFRLCRDLSGRRLVDVNNELRLRKWLSPVEVAKRRALGESYEEASGASGIAGWHLAVPSWADGVAVRNPYAEAARARRKTALCRDWVASRQDRDAPPAAPRWWGCPRGRDCPFAHGEEELRREAKVAAALARRDDAYARYKRELQDYTAGMYLYSAEADAGDGGGGGGGSGGGSGGGRSMLASVMAGVRAREGPALTPAAAAAAATAAAAAAAASAAAAAVAAATTAALAPATTPAAAQVAGVKRPREDAPVVAAAAGSAGSAGDEDAARVDLPVMAPAAAPAASGTASAAAVLPPGTAPSAAPWSDAGWVASLSGTGGDVAVEYFPGGDGSRVAEVEGRADFASVAVAGVGVGGRAGVYVYEVELLTAGIVQLGWCDTAFSPDVAAGDGVGDHAHSWAYDGARGLRWNGEPVEYGAKWAEGDVVRATLTLAAAVAAGGDDGPFTATMAFALNGEPQGTAFVLEGVPPDARLSDPPSREPGGFGGLRTPQCAAADADGADADGGEPSVLACRVAAKPVSVEPTPPPAAVAGPPPPPPTAAQFDIVAATSVAALRAAGVSGEVLKAELAARGLKAGGTWDERAARIVAIHDLHPDDYPAKLRK